MSSIQDLQVLYKCLKNGADHYILKPVLEDSLKNLWQTLFRKQKESLILKQLEQEKCNSSDLVNKTRKLEDEYSKMKEEMEQAVQKAIRILSMEVQSFLSQNSSTSADILLTKILQQLKEIQIYQDGFTKLIEDEHIEPLTKKWLAGLTLIFFKAKKKRY